MKNLTLLIILASIFISVNCASHIHTVGQGPSGSSRVESRQWYLLWGIVPINEVKTNEMVKEINDYEIKTEVTVLDFFLNMFTSLATVNSRTVIITK